MDFFHKCGHFLSPKRKIDNKVVYKEKLAWKKAEEAYGLPSRLFFKACKKHYLTTIINSEYPY